MTELSQTFNLRHLLYPKCPYNNSVVILISRLGVITFGTFGFSFLNLCLGPIFLIILSLFMSFSIIALLSLIGFIALLAVFGIYMRRKVCPTCAFMKECHAAF